MLLHASATTEEYLPQHHDWGGTVPEKSKYLLIVVVLLPTMCGVPGLSPTCVRKSIRSKTGQTIHADHSSVATPSSRNGSFLPKSWTIKPLCNFGLYIWRLKIDHLIIQINALPCRHAAVTSVQFTWHGLHGCCPSFWSKIFSSMAVKLHFSEVEASCPQFWLK